MSTDSVVALAVMLAVAGVGLIYLTVTAPARIKRAQTLDPRRQVKLVRDIPGHDALAAMAMDLGDLLGHMGDADDESTARSQALIQLLKAADWYWELSAAEKPTPDAPFWDLRTYWSTKAAYVLVYGGIAFGVGALIALRLDLLWLPPLAVLGGAVLGFIEPDSQLTKAARIRQDTMTIEVGFAVPKLYSLVRSKSAIDSAIRELVRAPGGPFIEEMRRVMRIYDTTGSMTPGLEQLIERNTNPTVRSFATAMKMAIERTGGGLAEALEIQALEARHHMIRYVKQKSQRNLTTSNGQVYTFMGALILGTLIIPVALIVAQSLTGGKL